MALRLDKAFDDALTAYDLLGDTQIENPYGLLDFEIHYEVFYADGSKRDVVSLTKLDDLVKEIGKSFNGMLMGRGMKIRRLERKQANPGEIEHFKKQADYIHRMRKDTKKHIDVLASSQKHRQVKKSLADIVNTLNHNGANNIANDKDKIMSAHREIKLDSQKLLRLLHQIHGVATNAQHKQVLKITAPYAREASRLNEREDDFSIDVLARWQIYTQLGVAPQFDQETPQLPGEPEPQKKGFLKKLFSRNSTSDSAESEKKPGRWRRFWRWVGNKYSNRRRARRSTKLLTGINQQASLEIELGRPGDNNEHNRVAIEKLRPYLGKPSKNLMYESVVQCVSKLREPHGNARTPTLSEVVDHFTEYCDFISPKKKNAYHAISVINAIRETCRNTTYAAYGGHTGWRDALPEINYAQYLQAAHVFTQLSREHDIPLKKMKNNYFGIITQVGVFLPPQALVEYAFELRTLDKEFRVGQNMIPPLQKYVRMGMSAPSATPQLGYDYAIGRLREELSK